MDAMALLKQIFPFSFGEKKDIAALIVNILIYLVAGIIIGIIIGVVAAIPIVGWIVGILGGLVDLYVLAGIVLSCLDYFKVLK